MSYDIFPSYNIDYSFLIIYRKNKKEIEPYLPQYVLSLRWILLKVFHQHTVMIRKFTLFCKLISIKTSSQSIFSSAMKTFIPGLEVCPHCGSKGNCVPFAYYDRHLVDFIHGHVCDTPIRVLRVQCSSCQHTHAILPDVIVPYASYSLFFILRVLPILSSHKTLIL